MLCIVKNGGGQVPPLPPPATPLTIDLKVWMVPVNVANMSHQLIFAGSAISTHRTILRSRRTHRLDSAVP